MASTASILQATAHRPWPLPEGPWVMFQSWRELLFAHWRVAADRLRAVVPPQLELDLYDGGAWLGIAPFRVTGLRPRPLPALPWLSEFLELNVRTYVRVRDRACVYFFSLDAGSTLAVLGARASYRLPYRRANMEMRNDRGLFRFTSRRRGGEARFEARYGPTGRASVPQPGTLEHFLTERYALATVLRSGRVLRAEIHHAPWPLQPAAAEIAVNTMATAAGVPLPNEAPLLHFSARQDTLVWAPDVERR